MYMCGQRAEDEVNQPNRGSRINERGGAGITMTGRSQFFLQFCESDAAIGLMEIIIAVHSIALCGAL
jgi:hypothetical protein